VNYFPTPPAGVRDVEVMWIRLLGGADPRGGLLVW
jgi:hypothetical protein